jgi:hypothetical protein
MLLFPLVRTALVAALCRLAGPRLRDARRAWRASAPWPVVLRLSRLNAPDTARDLVREVLFVFARPFAKSRCACLRTRLVWPCFGGGNFTPARRAFESPIAIAC